MASTSASSAQKSFKYDVFLSFRGEDTRKNFVDHLYYALHQKGIITYKDDERIEKGERINDQLMSSIEESRYYIIVFSKNYASSSWCLEELVKIMECQKMTEHTAYPIFYDVEPTEVRNQSGSVGEAFKQSTRKRKRTLEDVDLLGKHGKENDVGRWKDALIEAADLAGWELKNTVDGHEAKLIQKIVIDISLKLSFTNWSVDENLVGMETRLKNVVSSLEIGFEDVRMIGIKGMGGGGKTTLATTVFDHISTWFEGISFIEDVREVSKSSLSGLKGLQKQILSDVLNDQSIVVRSVSEGKNKMKKMMGSRKVLVVLDDVDDINQLEALAGKPNWFKPGSRIIITTRDEQVLIANQVKLIHNVNLLSEEEAICLFSRYAFGKEVPIQGYEDLSRKVIQYAAGLPLTIKVLASSLCGKAMGEWDDALKRLKTIPEEQTLKRLELSYIGLENDHKDIFLDVACILKGVPKDEAIRILESCGFYAQFGLKVLEQKSLITITNAGLLRLHDHIEEMGMNIVRRLHPCEPERHSRLWNKEEIENILANDLGTNATLSIKLKYTDLHPAIIMKGLRKMKNLRFLYSSNKHRKWTIHEVDEYLPNTLQSLHWHSYPFWCLPKTFKANKLVNVEMAWSNISQLWEGGEIKVLNKLRFLNLNYSKLKTFDLGLTPHLERLDLRGCADFVELLMPVECPSLHSLFLNGSKLNSLNLELTPNLHTLELSECNAFVKLNMPVKCHKLKSLSLCGSKLNDLNLGMIPNLEILELEGCNDFIELHLTTECPKLKFLDLSGSKVSKLNLGLTQHLERLVLRGCNEFVELHMPVECPKLKFLDLSGSKLNSFNLGLTPYLENLVLSGCSDFRGLDTLVECPRLKFLDLSNSKVSNLNLGLVPHLETLILEGCNDLIELHLPFECSTLKILNIRGSKVSNLHLGLTPHLERLVLGGCNNFVEFHMSVECPKLKLLDLSDSKLRNLNLGKTPSLETLVLRGCPDFVELHMPVECPMLKFLDLSGSKVRTLNLGLAPYLETLDLEGCNDFVELLIPNECQKLKFFNLSGSKVSNLNLGLTPHLERLVIRGCNDFVELHMPFECLKLKILDLSGSKVSNLNLRLAPYVETLSLQNCNDFVQLTMPNEYSKLRFLDLSGSKVSNLNSGLTPYLERLVIRGCIGFVELQMPFECSKLTFLDLSGSMVSNLNLGLVPNLETLVLDGCKNFVKLYMPVECPKLKFLNFSGSKISDIDLGLTPHLETLVLRGCNDFVELRMPVECTKLNFLDLSGSKVSKLNLGLTPHLRSLDLKNCCYLQEVQAPSGCGSLEKVVYLNLSGCLRFQHFLVAKECVVALINSKATLELTAESLDICPLHPNNNLPKFQFKCIYDEPLPSSSGNLEKLLSFGLCACTCLESFSASICGLRRLQKLTLEGNIPEAPKDLNQLERLEELTLSMKEIKRLPGSICMLEYLKSLNLKSCCFLEQLPEDLDGLKRLEQLYLMDCISLRDIPNNICKLKRLKYLHLPYCILVEKLPEELGNLKCLKELNIEGAGISQLPHSIFQLKGLCIVWSRGRLESYGFTSLTEISTYTASCLV